MFEIFGYVIVGIFTVYMGVRLSSAAWFRSKSEYEKRKGK